MEIVEEATAFGYIGKVTEPAIRVFMPIFEYQCRDCGAKFEKIVTSAGATATCKNCRSPRVTMLLSTFAVAGTSPKSAPSEPGPCGVCGAPRRGMCGE